MPDQARGRISEPGRDLKCQLKECAVVHIA
jgi:hypothetical protein